MAKLLIVAAIYLAIMLWMQQAVFGQLPDAPQPSTAKCGPWSCWNPHIRPNAEVLKNGAFLFAAVGDAAVATFDVEMTHQGLAHHRCVEANPGLPLHPSRGQLYRSDAMEEATVAGFGFLSTKLGLPRWITLAMLPYPAEVHIRGGMSWVGRCW
jgi:hypothetical protein